MFSFALRILQFNSTLKYRFIYKKLCLFFRKCSPCIVKKFGSVKILFSRFWKNVHTFQKKKLVTLKEKFTHLKKCS